MKPRSLAMLLLVSLGVLEARVAHAEGPVDSVPKQVDSTTDPATAPTPAAPAAPENAEPAADLSAASAPKLPGAAAGPTTATAEEADLAQVPSSDSFSNEDAAEAEQQHRLDLYGFADLTYTRVLAPKSNPWTRVMIPTNSFAVGNFNLYMSSNLGDSWRALGEVRFLYLPNGASTTDANTGQVARTDTTVLDYAGFEEPIRWGGIRIERVWVEHEFSSLFKLQVGAFLTPYGIWNVDHGTPAIVGIRKPFAVAEELFPSHQTGLQLYGNTFFEPFEIGYHLTLSNGRGPVEYQDFSDDKAVGGRLYLKTDAFGSLTLGSSAYRGGYYDRSAQYVVLSKDGQSVVDQKFTTTSKYEEFSFGADLKWEYKRLLLQSEFIMNDVAYASGARPRLQVYKPPNGFQSDFRRWGIYGLLGYRTHLLQTMPYVIVQYVYEPDIPVLPPVSGAQFGLNIRPTPAVVLKLEVSVTHFSGPGSIGLGLSPLRFVSSQVAWAF